MAHPLHTYIHTYIHSPAYSHSTDCSTFIIIYHCGWYNRPTYQVDSVSPHPKKLKKLHKASNRDSVFHWLYIPVGPWPLIFQFHDHFTDGRTPWTSDQLVARPLPKHRTTWTQNKHIPNIHTLCGIRTHDPGFRASEDSTCLRPLGYRDRLEPR
jgi:hypothetical protein